MAVPSKLETAKNSHACLCPNSTTIMLIKKELNTYKDSVLTGIIEITARHMTTKAASIADNAIYLVLFKDLSLP